MANLFINCNKTLNLNKGKMIDFNSVTELNETEFYFKNFNTYEKILVFNPVLLVEKYHKKSEDVKIVLFNIADLFASKYSKEHTYNNVLFKDMGKLSDRTTIIIIKDDIDNIKIKHPKTDSIFTDCLRDVKIINYIISSIKDVENHLEISLNDYDVINII